MSEEVVLEKFKSYGIEVTKLDRKDNKFLVHTLIKSLPTVFELENSTGAVKLDGKSLYLKPTANAFAPIIEPDLKRVPWNERTIRFEKMSIEGIRLPARPIQR